MAQVQAAVAHFFSVFFKFPFFPDYGYFLLSFWPAN